MNQCIPKCSDPRVALSQDIHENIKEHTIADEQFAKLLS